MRITFIPTLNTHLDFYSYDRAGLGYSMKIYLLMRRKRIQVTTSKYILRLGLKQIEQKVGSADDLTESADGLVLWEIDGSKLTAKEFIQLAVKQGPTD